jgi:TolB protein
VNARGNKQGRLGCWLLIAALALALGQAQAHAQGCGGGDEICVVPGQDKLIKIMIPTIRGVDPKAAEEITRVLRRDLEISGLFEIIPPPTGGALGAELLSEGLAVTDFSGWASAGANTFVKGDITLVGSNLVADLRLYDANQRRQLLLSYEKPPATAANPKPAAHAFANAIIKYYTGQDGIFGQQMLVVRRNRAKGESHVYRVSTDGEGLSQVSSGGGINTMPGVGPGGAPMYITYSSSGPSLRVGSQDIAQDAISRPDYCPGNGRVAVALSSDGNAELYTMNTDGSGRRRLTENSYIDTSPSWSPDCAKIAFISNRGGGPQVYVMSASGGGATPLTTGKISSYIASPSWSPQGDRVAFSARDEGGRFDIFVIDADGSGAMERLTQDQGRNEDPTWSPDGNYIAFTSDRASGAGLYIMPARSRNSRQSMIAGGSFAMPAWSF